MGWIKKMKLKKALFTLAFLNILVATVLSILVFWGCSSLASRTALRYVQYQIGGEANIGLENQIPYAGIGTAGMVFSVLQIVLPLIFFVTALLATASMFYRWKLKEPLGVLMEGANRIMENDLDFTMRAQSDDELGKLCVAFETMRQSLLKNNRELWRQAEERKRLNAAFAHDLRNPVTVLKGSVRMARQCAAEGQTGREQLLENLMRMENYTGRIERYVDIMSRVQRLEQVWPERAPVNICAMADELEKALRFAALDGDKQLVFHCMTDRDNVMLDKNMLFQMAENLVSNAVRFAAQRVSVSLRVQDDSLVLEVADDGAGFPEELLKKGVQPFQSGRRESSRGDDQGGGHFGMGLYICSLLCQKHGGRLDITNTSPGAVARGIIKIS